MRGMRTCVLTVAALLAAAPLAEAQTELLVGTGRSVQLPVKGRINIPDGEVRLVFKVYNQASEGRLIQQEARTVPVSRGVYFAMIATSALNRAVWVEVDAAGRRLGERQAFRIVTEAEAALEPDAFANRGFAGLCFTCGDGLSRFVGSFQDVSGQPFEYGSSCSGNSPVQTNDSRPFLCSRAR
jgi:hypothetical protein